MRGLKLKLDLDSGKFSASMKDATGRLKNFDQAVKQSSQALSRIDKSLSSQTKNLRDYTVILAHIPAAIHTIRSATVSWVADMVKTASELQRSSFMLEGLSDQMSAIGKEKDAKKNLSELFNLSQKAPFSLNKLQGAFVKLRAGGIKDAQTTLEGVVNAVAQFGGTDDTLEHATLALEQMSGKGVVSMEELRRQLGEAVPSAIRLMAAGMGKSYATLVQQVSTGTVESKNAIKKMITMFDQAYGGAAQKMMDTYSGKVSLLKTRWLSLQGAVMGFSFDENNEQVISQNGFYQKLVDVLDNLADTLKDPEFKQFGAEFGENLKSALSFTQEFIRGVTQISETIPVFSLVKDAVISMLAVFAAGKILSFGRAAVSTAASLARLSDTMIASTQDLRAYMQLKKEATAAELAYMQKLKWGSLALKEFGIASMNLIPVIGQIVAVVWTLADAFGVFEDKAKAGREALDEYQSSGAVTGKSLSAVDTLIKSKKAQLDKLKKAYAGLSRYGSQEIMMQGQDNYNAHLSQQKKQIQELTKEIENATAARKRMAATYSSNSNSGFASAWVKDKLRDTNKTLRDQISQAYGTFRKSFGASDEEVSAARTIYVEKATTAYQNQLSYIDKLISAEQRHSKTLKKNSDAYKVSQQVITAYREAQKKTDNQLRGVQNLSKKDVILKPKGQGFSYANIALNHARQAAAGLKAQMTGAGVAAAKMTAALQTDPQLIKEAPAMKRALMEAANEVDRMNAGMSQVRARKRLVTIYSNSATAVKKLEQALRKELQTATVGTHSNALMAASVSALGKAAGESGDAVADNTNKMLDRLTLLKSLKRGLDQVITKSTRYKAKGDDIFAQIDSGATSANTKAAKLVSKLEALKALIPKNTTDSSLLAYREQIENLIPSVQASAKRLDAADAYASIVSETKDMNAQMTSNTQRSEEQQTQIQIDQMAQRLGIYDDSVEKSKSVLNAFYAWREAKLQSAEQENEGPIAQMARNFDNMSQQIKDSTGDWLNTFTDDLVEGKGSFSSFTKSILADIAKIILRAVIARAIMAAIGMATSASGIGSGVSTSSSQSILGSSYSGTGQVMTTSSSSLTSSLPSVTVPTNHTGGIAGFESSFSKTVPANVFNGAPKYHTGGIAGDEQPAILKKKEGVFTEGQMKALGAGSHLQNKSTQTQQTPQVSVNVINQSGVSMSAQQSGQKFDGQKMIVDVVLNAMSKPGRMREAIKGVNSK